MKIVSKPISQGNPSYTLYTDASLQGWGAVFQGQSSGGHWAPDEARQHINCLELKAAYLGLQSFCTTLSRTHVRIFLDNTTAVSYINNMGGTHSLECNHIARTIWMWYITQDIWLSAAHLPGKCNTAADKPPEFLMTIQSGSLIPTFMCQSLKLWGPHLLIYLHPGLIFRLSLT